MIETILDILPELKKTPSYQETWASSGEIVWPLNLKPNKLIIALDSALIWHTSEGTKSLLPGKNLGLAHFFDPNKIFYDTIAEHPTRIIHVSFDDLSNLLEDHPLHGYLRNLSLHPQLSRFKDFLLFKTGNLALVRKVVAEFRAQQSLKPGDVFLTFNSEGWPILKTDPARSELSYKLSGEDQSWVSLIKDTVKPKSEHMKSWKEYQHQLIQEIKGISHLSLPLFLINFVMTITLAKIISLGATLPQSELMTLLTYLFIILILSSVLDYFRQQEVTNLEINQEKLLSSSLVHLNQMTRTNWWFRYLNLNEQFRKIIIHEFLPLLWTTLNTTLLLISWIRSTHVAPWIIILLVLLFLLMITWATLRHIKLKEETELSIEKLESASWDLLDAVLDYRVSGRLMDLLKSLETTIHDFWDSLKKQINNTLSPMFLIDITWCGLLILSLVLSSKINTQETLFEIGTIIIGLEIIKSLQAISSSSFRIGDLIHVKRTLAMNWPEEFSGLESLQEESFVSLDFRRPMATKDRQKWWWPAVDFTIENGRHYSIYFSDSRSRDLFALVLSGQRRLDAGKILMNGIELAPEHRGIFEDLVYQWPVNKKEKLDKKLVLFNGKQDELSLKYFSESYDQLKQAEMGVTTLILTCRPEIAALSDHVLSFHKPS